MGHVRRQVPGQRARDGAAAAWQRAAAACRCWCRCTQLSHGCGAERGQRAGRGRRGPGFGVSSEYSEYSGAIRCATNEDLRSARCASAHSRIHEVRYGSVAQGCRRAGEGRRGQQGSARRQLRCPPRSLMVLPRSLFDPSRFCSIQRAILRYLSRSGGTPQWARAFPVGRSGIDPAGPVARRGSA